MPFQIAHVACRVVGLLVLNLVADCLSWYVVYRNDNLGLGGERGNYAGEEVW